MPQAEKIRVGCSGWSYQDWGNIFYPEGLSPRDYLPFYSRFFNCVEIDSSFYRTPSPLVIDQWKKATPAGFLFASKLPKKITHENKLENIEPFLIRFYGSISRFGERLGPIVAQLPPSIKLDKHRALMEKFVASLEPKFRHAIEFRHKSWFTPETYRLLEKHGVAMAWSLNQYLETPSDITSNFVYLRMVGDREITKFTGIQKDMSPEMKRWAEKLREKENDYENAFVFFNNHFAGFGPASVNEFRRLLGMMELDWTQQAKTGERQGSLGEF